MFERANKDQASVPNEGPAENGAQKKGASVSLKFRGAIVGTLAGLSEGGTPRVDFPGNPAAAELEARSCAAIDANDVGKQVVLLFDEGDGLRPLVIGVVQPPVPLARGEYELKLDAHLEESVVEIDGKAVELAATEKLTLRCGAASITLTRDGKVLIRGAYVQSRSSGTNRIQGGSVQIN